MTRKTSALNLDHIKKLVKLLKKQGWYADPLVRKSDDYYHARSTKKERKQEYLIRFSDGSGDKQCLLLMGDMGITWEPARAWPTEAFGYIKGNDPEKDAARMIKLGLNYYKGKNDNETS